ncbi:hypothetical protein [Streptomyces sp. NPDC057702]|uniref:hypothetical protein n=1 Tax=unclassified Streptomyces TaxID=2593676 RepID=UPI00369339E3
MARRTTPAPRRAGDTDPARARRLTATVVALLLGVLGLLSPTAHPARAATPQTTAAQTATTPAAPTVPWAEAATPPATSAGVPPAGTTDVPASMPAAPADTGPPPTQPAPGTPDADPARASSGATTGRTVVEPTTRLGADAGGGPAHALHGPHSPPEGTWPRLNADHSGTRHTAPPPGLTLLPVPVVFTPPVGWRAPPTAPYADPHTRPTTPYSGRAPPPPLGS